MPKRSNRAITKSRIDAMNPGEQMWDSNVVGFGIVANSNSKSFKLKYRFRGQQRMLTIGTFGSPYTVDTARNEAIKHLGTLKSGTDPMVQTQTGGMTVTELCDEYMKRHAGPHKKASSANQDAMNIKNHVKPLLGKLRVEDVTSHDIERFKSDVQLGKTAPSDRAAVQKAQKGGAAVSGGKGAANRSLALLSTMFSRAELWGYRQKGSNPVKGVSKFKENPKERYLSDQELADLWAYLNGLEVESGLDSEGNPLPSTNVFVSTAIKLLLLTGARKNEILQLTWSMVDLENRKLYLPDSKTGKKTIQLVDTAVELLEDLPRLQGNPYVIAGTVDGKPLVNLQKPWKAIREALGLTDVRIHDLRHSFASFAIRQNVSIQAIGALLGHKSPLTTHRYTHLADKHLVQENDKIGRSILKITQSSSGPEIDKG